MWVPTLHNCLFLLLVVSHCHLCWLFSLLTVCIVFGLFVLKQCINLEFVLNGCACVAVCDPKKESNISGLYTIYRPPRWSIYNI